MEFLNITLNITLNIALNITLNIALKYKQRYEVVLLFVIFSLTSSQVKCERKPPHYINRAIKYFLVFYLSASSFCTMLSCFSVSTKLFSAFFREVAVDVKSAFRLP